MSAPDWPFPGSRWWKFDFHTHTPRSTDYGKARTDEAVLKARSPEEWLLDFMKAEIDCVAVTDHNSGEWISELKTALTTLEREGRVGYRPLTLFPGVELSVGRCHYLALFDPQVDQSRVQGLIGFARYRGTPGASDGCCEASISDIASEVFRLGGLLIPAHADVTTGIFNELRGHDLRPILQCENVIAVEMINPESPMPGLYTEAKLRWTRILGSDSHHPDAGSDGGTRYPGSHFTWVKMAKPSLEALRLALIDGADVSIRRSDDARPGFRPFDTPEDLIECITVANARFMGRNEPQVFQFSPWLNALVGGRGSGKSTVVHLLRLAMQREGDLDRFEKSPLLREFNRFRRVSSQRNDEGALLADTSLELVYRHQGSRYQISFPENGSSVSVKEWNDFLEDWTPASSQEVRERFPVRIFSQGQIAELAGERSEALLDLVNQAVDFNEWKSRWDDQERAFFTLRNRGRELAGKLDARDRIVGELDDVLRKLKRFEESDHAVVLSAYGNRQSQVREVEQALEEALEIANRIREISAACRFSEVPEGVFDPKDTLANEALAAIQRVHAAIEEAATSLENIATNLVEAEAGVTTALDVGPWRTDVSATEEEYRKLVEDLQSQGVNDPSEYGRLVQDRLRLEEELATMDLLTSQAAEIDSQCTEVLRELLVLRREISERRSRFLVNTLATNAYVRIELQPYGRDPRALEDSIRNLLVINEDSPPFEQDIYREGDGENKPPQGIVVELLKDLPETGADLEMELRIENLRQGFVQTAMGGEFDQISSKLRTRILKTADQRAEYIDHILTWYPEDGLKVTYSPGSDGGDFRPIQQGSAGQRAAAMLAFLLAYGGEPIIIDQPEDDLDNHLITRLVVDQMRENKARRQIICVTHNPNIVVNGDAEMVHALDSRRSQCMITVKGSLQDNDVREEVCRVMEGGRDAFEQRYRRIGNGGRYV